MLMNSQLPIKFVAFVFEEWQVFFLQLCRGVFLAFLHSLQQGIELHISNSLDLLLKVLNMLLSLRSVVNKFVNLQSLVLTPIGRRVPIVLAVLVKNRVVEVQFAESIEYSRPPGEFSLRSCFLVLVNGVHLPIDQSVLLVVVFTGEHGELGLVVEVDVLNYVIHLRKGRWEVVVVLYFL